MSKSSLNEQVFLTNCLALLQQGRGVAIGPGDDCAAIDPGGDSYLLLTVDQLIAGIHYLPETTTPGQAAGKLLKRNLSDIAAMAGMPNYALLTIAADFAAMPAPEQWLTEFYRTLNTEAAKWQISVCGGDISSISGPQTVMTMTVTGRVNKNRVCRRAAAQAGEQIYCTGRFGRSFPSGHHLTFTPRLQEAEFLAAAGVRTMIDVSDGLLLDLRRLASASNVGAVIRPELVPRRDHATTREAMTDGEDYELLFAVKPELEKQVITRWPFSIPLTAIGFFTTDTPGRVTDQHGRDLFETFSTGGYDHFEQ